MSILFSAALTASPRHLQSLNGTWDFRIDPYGEGERQAWYREWQQSRGQMPMPVPGNWDLQNEYHEYVGTAWYRRVFEGQVPVAGRRVWLHFEAVSARCQVWLNGHKVGQNESAYLPFALDVTAHVRSGAPNELVLQVDNLFRAGAVWTWGGIRRPVWLESVASTQIEAQFLSPVPDLATGRARIENRVELRHGTIPTVAPQRWVWTIRRSGEIVATATGEIAPGSLPTETGAVIALEAEQVQLWHFDRPQLYESSFALHAGEEVTDEVRDRFGIRKIEVVGEALLLNGEPIRLVGVNLVPEDRATGNTLPLWRIQQDVDLMKQLGVNLTRLSHFPLPEDFSDYLDEKGILVFDEIPVWGTTDLVHHENPLPIDWLRRLVRQKFNHPSTIGWSVGNEIGKLDENPHVMEYVEARIAQVKALDPQRLAVYVSHTAQKQDVDPIRYADLLMVNTYTGGWGPAAMQAVRRHGPKPLFMSEFGDVLSSEDLNLGKIAVEKMMASMAGREPIIGASLWTFNDYRSNYRSGPGWDTPPSQNRPWGVVDTFRQKKRAWETTATAFAPLADLRLALDGPEAAERTFSIALEPRGVLALPAVPLRNYLLAWKIVGQEQAPLDAGVMCLPEILPGAEPLNLTVPYAAPLHYGAVRFEVSLVDGQGYRRMRRELDLALPGRPEITEVQRATDEARVYFQRGQNAREHYVEYGAGDFSQKTELTILDWVEISKLPEEGAWQFRVVAVNGLGQSEPSASREVVANVREQLPPHVRGAMVVDGALFISYSVRAADTTYEVELGSAMGEWARRLSVSTRGVTRLPLLGDNEPEQVFRFRSRGRSGNPSMWSPAFPIPHAPEAEVIAISHMMVGSTSAETVLELVPHARAVAYRVWCAPADGPEKQWAEQRGTELHFLRMPKVPEGSRVRVEGIIGDNRPMAEQMP